MCAHPIQWEEWDDLRGVLVAYGVITPTTEAADFESRMATLARAGVSEARITAMRATRQALTTAVGQDGRR